MKKVVEIHEWDSDLFHRRVLELEAKGYVTQRETYRIQAEMNPDTGEIIHLHTIEMYKPDEEKVKA